MTTPDETPPPPATEELPVTPLASLVAKAKEHMAARPDRHGPAAVKAMAAIVRDLKGMPELTAARDSASKLRLTRKGRVGHVVIEFDAAIACMIVTVGGFSEERAPGDGKPAKFALHGDVWQSMEGGDDLFADIHARILKLYPELA